MDKVGTRGKTGLCVETHDLAASKLAAHREKDRNFVRTLLNEALVQGKILRQRVGTLSVDEEHRARLLHWINVTLADLAG